MALVTGCWHRRGAICDGSTVPIPPVIRGLGSILTLGSAKPPTSALVGVLAGSSRTLLEGALGVGRVGRLARALVLILAKILGKPKYSAQPTALLYSSIKLIQPHHKELFTSES